MIKQKLILVFFGLSFFTYINAQDGTLDTSFGSNGIVTLDINNDNIIYHLNAITTQPDGKIIVAGHSNSMGTENFCLVRLNSNGSIDKNFGINGFVSTSFLYKSTGLDVSVQNDGKIILSGHTWEGTKNAFALARYNANGSLDNSFGEFGQILTTFGIGSGLNGGTAKALKIQNDGKIVVGGTRNHIIGNDSYSFVIVRYNKTGSIDNTFGVNGFTSKEITGWLVLNDIAIQKDGKIIACGGGSGGTKLVRYNSKGILDSSFGLNGKSESLNGYYKDLDIQKDGKIIAVGFYRDINGVPNHIISRYLPDGNLDPTFGNSGIISNSVNTDFVGGDEVIIQKDNKIIVGGSIIKNSYLEVALTRYHTNGTPDLTFGQNGIILTNMTTHYRSTKSTIALQENGKILATGYDAPPNSNRKLLISRYSSTTLSLEDPTELVGNVSVYPNPTSNKINITFKPKNSEAIHIKIYNTIGQTIYEGVKTSFTPLIKNTETIQFEDYSKGIYFLNISSVNKHQTIKIVKN